jgi:hypothetical protein
MYGRHKNLDMFARIWPKIANQINLRKQSNSRNQHNPEIPHLVISACKTHLGPPVECPLLLFDLNKN